MPRQFRVIVAPGTYSHAYQLGEIITYIGSNPSGYEFTNGQISQTLHPSEVEEIINDPILSNCVITLKDTIYW
jgi:hypothetical protein